MTNGEELNPPVIGTLAVTPLRAAELSGRNRTRVFSAIRDGELVARKDGKATIIEIEELRRWIRSMPTAPPKALKKASA